MNVPALICCAIPMVIGFFGAVVAALLYPVWRDWQKREPGIPRLAVPVQPIVPMAEPAPQPDDTPIVTRAVYGQQRYIKVVDEILRLESPVDWLERKLENIDMDRQGDPKLKDNAKLN